MDCSFVHLCYLLACVDNLWLDCTFEGGLHTHQRLLMVTSGNIEIFAIPFRPALFIMS